MNVTMKAERVVAYRDVYNVTLEQHEAEILVTLLRSVGGDPNGPRGHMNELREELVKAGIADMYHVYCEGAVRFGP